MPQPLTLADYLAQGQNAPDPGAAMRLAPFMPGQQGMDTTSSVGGGQTVPMPNAAQPKSAWTGMPAGDTGKKKKGFQPLATPPPAAPSLLPVNDDKRQELLNTMDPARMGALQEQKTGLKALQAEYERQRGRTPDVNLAPLLGLSDTWFGGNQSKNYQQPLRQEDLDKLATDLQVKLQGGRQALSEDEVNLLKSQLGAEEKHQDTAAKLNAMMEGRYEHDTGVAAGKTIAAINAGGMRDAAAIAKGEGKETGDMSKHWETMVNRGEGGRGAPQNFTKAQLAQSSVARAQQLFAKLPKGPDGEPDYNQMSPTQVHLLNNELETLATNGAATVSGREGQDPHTLSQNLAQLQNKFVGPNDAVVGANLGPFIKQSAEYINGLGDVANGIVHTYRRSNLDNYTSGDKPLLTPSHKETYLMMHHDLIEPGDVIQGRKFKGGDVGDEKNWEIQK